MPKKKLSQKEESVEEKLITDYHTKGIGTLLGLYIAKLDAPIDFKDALLVSLGEMSLRQQLELLKIFEEAYIADGLQVLGKSVQKKLEERLEQYKKEKSDIVHTLTSNMKDIVSKLKNKFS